MSPVIKYKENLQKTARQALCLQFPAKTVAYWTVGVLIFAILVSSLTGQTEITVGGHWYSELWVSGKRKVH